MFVLFITSNHCSECKCSFVFVFIRSLDFHCWNFNYLYSIFFSFCATNFICNDTHVILLIRSTTYRLLFFHSKTFFVGWSACDIFVTNDSHLNYFWCLKKKCLKKDDKIEIKWKSNVRQKVNRKKSQILSKLSKSLTEWFSFVLFRTHFFTSIFIHFSIYSKVCFIFFLFFPFLVVFIFLHKQRKIEKKLSLFLCKLKLVECDDVTIIDFLIICSIFRTFHSS